MTFTTSIDCSAWGAAQTIFQGFPDMHNNRSSKSTVLVYLMLVLCVAGGCTSTGPTRLFDDFQSYQTPNVIRGVLNSETNQALWTEDSKKFDPVPPDRRPAYKFTYLSGPYKSLGISGQLKLTFYNDRLMEVQFSTINGRAYLEALRTHSKTPARPSEEIISGGRTRLRFDVDPDGSYLFTWYDPKLQIEWLRWVAAYA